MASVRRVRRWSLEVPWHHLMTLFFLVLLARGGVYPMYYTLCILNPMYYTLYDSSP